MKISEEKNNPPLAELILDNISEGVFTITPDKTITKFNRVAEEITGIPREVAIGQKCYDIFRSSICQVDCALEESINTGRRIMDRAVEILTNSGEKIPILIRASALRDDQNQIIGGVETFQDISGLKKLNDHVQEWFPLHGIIGASPALRRSLDILKDVAESDSNVLIEGESGVGKELFAKAVHRLSHRSTGPVVAVNCGALPEPLLESELFGYVKGAFTDARRDHPGRLAAAECGTLFLDEIGEMSPALQIKLLRVLDQNEYTPLGAVKPIKADVRFIAATHRNLKQMMMAGTFREDLFYRLNVARMFIPPLRDRREDIPLLADYFIDRFNRSKNRSIESLTPESLNLLMAYQFPGNVRELLNIIEYAFILCRNQMIQPEHLPPEVQQVDSCYQATPGEPSGSLRAKEQELMLQALKRHRNNRAATARELGLSRTTLWRRMKLAGLSPARNDGQE
ncbi:MAG: sigma 54-interacting transcriptional regulator [Deltaproteobacteria bacterium]|nr:sigma 54-interacting transcriptional regulator [Deltaproteobacteria bacterium]